MVKKDIKREAKPKEVAVTQLDVSVVDDAWKSYQKTPISLKMIDVFMAFLVFTGVTQFAYCLLVGNYPFNAFLAGFTATIGQFVLAAGLRSQCNTTNDIKITQERAFGDFIFASVVLHFAVVNFLG